jgi:hypothetical protein
MNDRIGLNGAPTPFRQSKPESLRNPGVGRDAENDKALCFYYSRRVTDYEMRFLHGVMERAVACMPEGQS